MKNKFFSFILSFTVIAVAVTAVNCGCAFAVMPMPQPEMGAAGHCEKNGEEKVKAEPEECCIGCQLETGAINPYSLDYHVERSKESSFSDLLLAGNIRQNAGKHPITASRFKESLIRGVSAPNISQPIYIVLESFLI